MQTSSEIKAISTALVAFHKEVSKIPKDSNNPFFKSKYASLSGILDAINEPLINNGLAIIQFPERENELTTRIVHTSGEWMEATYYVKSVKDTPQDKGSAITYQRRYAIGAVLSLNIDDDDDGNAGSGKAGQAPAASQKGADDNKPWLNKDSKEFKAAAARLTAGTATLKQLRDHFKISKEVQELLEGYIPSNI